MSFLDRNIDPCSSNPGITEYRYLSLHLRIPILIMNLAQKRGNRQRKRTRWKISWPLSFASPIEEESGQQNGRTYVRSKQAAGHTCPDSAFLHFQSASTAD
jgi:hypothetical protein